MANIRVDLELPIIDGQSITFKAPCGCDTVSGLRVYYPDGETTSSKVFTFRDTHGNDLTGVDNLFVANTYVKVIVDTTNCYAYIQNADTNKYLESILSDFSDQIEGLSATVTSASKIQNGSYTGNGADGKTLNFNFTPKFLVITSGSGQNYTCTFVKSSTKCTVGVTSISWSTNSVRITGNVSSYNASGQTYSYIALG